MEKRQLLGRKGEEAAVIYLQGQGYHIRRRNYRYGKAEIDIIAERAGILAIVEVRSRREELWERTAESVRKKKIRLLTEAADRYVQARELAVEVRFDIITVHYENGQESLEHLPNAFYHF